MSYFGTALQRWFSARPGGTTISEVSSTADLPQGDLSSIRLGKKAITFKALSKLLPAIERLSDRAQARDLLVAYLRDEVPAGWAGDMVILPDAGTVGEGSAGLRDPLDAVASRWRQRAEHDQEFGEMWLTLDHYMHEPHSEDLEVRLGALRAARPHDSGAA